VANSVEVLSKSEGAPHAVKWVSDGSGEFEVYDAENVSFTRGTLIKLYLNPESRNFS